jgi:hypothetical protein
MNIRTVTVEFLRAGPRHNQLLSPLTQYLAVCGDSPAGVVNLPYEHAVFERRREELRYAVSSDSDQDRLRGILDQTGSEMAGILASVPGLPGALTARNEPSELLNLRLVLSASELALLPFELSKIPVGGGASPDNWLQLQGNSPVCLTRHNRAVRSDGVKWPTRPRILFAYGEDVPYERHLKALKEALEPWTSDESTDDWLTVLKEATLENIASAIRQTDFTHVHILAHGAPFTETSFGVGLKDSVVTGRELASALFDVNSKRIHRPTVVTLATCDSGALGSVVNAPDVSVAHDLHEAGIPLVVASQFPLSTDGSVPFVRMFYSDQLKGVHPVLSLYRVRLMLHALNASRYHDWASLVIYEALPANLNDQLLAVCYAQSRLALERTLTIMESAADDPNKPATPNEHACHADAVQKAHGELPDNGPYAVECVGLRAASWKRLAHADYKLAKASEADSEVRRQHAESCYLNLQRAVADYRAAAMAFLVNVNQPAHRKATLHWLLGQMLSLEAVLGKEFNHDYWIMARLSAEADLAHVQEDGVVWGHGTVAELKLLRLTDGSLTDGQAAEVSKEVLEHASTLVSQNSLVSEPVSSTRRQFARYKEWWSQADFAEMLEPFEVPPKTTWAGPHRLVDTAERALKIMGYGRVKDQTKRRPKCPPPTGPADSGPKPPSSPPDTPVPPNPEFLAPRSSHSASGIFDIEMIPAHNGDCLWIEYGHPKAPSRILIDCGAESAAKLLNARVAKLQTADAFELFVLTHIDADHISGVLPFFKNRGALTFGEVWFNAEPQLPPAVLGVMQGEKFANILNSEPGLRAAWNKSAGQGEKAPKAIVVPDEGSLPSYTLPGGMRLTVLSPGLRQLKDLASVWRKELRLYKQGKSHDMLSAKARPLPVNNPATLDVAALAKMKEKPDPSVANGSSIALLAEFDGRAVLLTGDAHAEVMAASIKRLRDERGIAGRLRLDAMKLSHHGSTNALTKGLLDLIECPQYLVSTDGSKFYHPDRDAIARVILHGGQNPKLIFNYKSEMNGFWGEPVLRDKYGYRTEYPAGAPGKRVSL